MGGIVLHGRPHPQAAAAVGDALAPDTLNAAAAEEVPGTPPFFAEILEELSKRRAELGGLRHFPDRPRLDRKIKAEEFRTSYSDYEYIYLTVLGFAQLHVLLEEIVRRNNGRVFTQNPGVQLLERSCGMTMHGDREGANALLRAAPASLLEAFRFARSRPDGMREFFAQAFDRRADPCLEGRTGRLLAYLEKAAPVGGDVAGPPWEEVSLRPLPQGTPPREVVGEHLRVFVGECTYRWARQCGLGYEAAKAARDAGRAEGFSLLYNAAAFEASLRLRGIVAELVPAVCHWETLTDAGEWSAYEASVTKTIEEARQRGQATLQVRLGPRAWMYELDLTAMVQRNPKTGKARPIRSVSGSAPLPHGKLSAADVSAAIQFFIQVETLPASP